MKRSNSKKKIINIFVVCVFLLNTVVSAQPANINNIGGDLLQVETPFKPITDVLGQEYELQIKIEAALIMAMAMRGESVYKINMELEKSSSIYNELKIGKKIRLFEVADPAIEENKETVFDIKVRHGKARGETFRITSLVSGISQIQQTDLMDNTKTSIKVEKLGKKGKTFIPDQWSIKAPHQLYYIKTECYREVENVLKRKAASIIADPDTAELRYYKEGKALKGLEGEVFYLEGQKWEMKQGVDLPGNVKDIINTENGALVITTGPFYENKHKKAIIFVKHDPELRKLTDREIYERFKLKRVYDYRGKMFTLPVLGVGGKSLLLPVRYTIKTVEKGRGIEIAGKNIIYDEKKTRTMAVFGLEFKNVGTIAYTEHNKTPGRYPDFPPTSFESYRGMPGIFLDWEYSIDTRSPVGLSRGPGKSKTREEALLEAGSVLTRWTLAESVLSGEYGIKLRVPVGDYRRLSVFFSRYGSPETRNFQSVIAEIGETAEEYLLELAGSYGKNFRNNIETGIIQTEHGSIINSDIDGNGTDYEDFLRINDLEPKKITAAAEAWVDNLLRIISLAGVNETERDRIITEFAAGFFYCQKSLIIMERNPDGTIDTDRLKKEIIELILEKEEKQGYLTGNYTRQDLTAGNKKTIVIHVKDTKNRDYDVTLDKRRKIGEIELLKRLKTKGQDLEEYGKLILAIIRHFNRTGTKIYTFEYTGENFYGVVSATDNFIAVREDLIDDPAAVIFLMMESLLKKRALRLTLDNNRLKIKTARFKTDLNAGNAVEEMRKENLLKEGSAGKGTNKSNHYLLSILTRQILGEADKRSLFVRELDQEYSGIKGISKKAIRDKERVLDTVDQLTGGLKSSNPQKRARSAEIIALFLEAGLIAEEDITDRSMVKGLIRGLSNTTLGISGKCARAIKAMVELELITKEEVERTLPYEILISELESPFSVLRVPAAEAIRVLAEAGLFDAEQIIRTGAAATIVSGIKQKGEAADKEHNSRAMRFLVEAGAITREMFITTKGAGRTEREGFVKVLFDGIEGNKNEKTTAEYFSGKKLRLAYLELLFSLASKGLLKTEDFDPGSRIGKILNKRPFYALLNRALYDSDYETSLKAAECVALFKELKLVAERDLNRKTLRDYIFKKEDIHFILEKDILFGSERGLYAAKKVKYLLGEREKKAFRKRIDIKALVAGLKNFEGGKQGYSAGILLELIAAGMISRKDIRDTGLLKELADTVNVYGEISIKSAMIMVKLLEKGLIKKEDLAGVSFSRIKDMIKGGNYSSRANAGEALIELEKHNLIKGKDLQDDEITALLLKEAVNIGDPSSVETARMIKKLTNAGIIKVYDKKETGFQRLEREYRETFKMDLPRSYYIYYLRLLPHIRTDNLSILKSPEYLTRELLRLSSIGGKLFYQKLAREIKQGSSPEQALIRTRKDVTEYQIGRTESGEAEQIQHSARKVGELIAESVNTKKQLEDKFFEAFRTLDIEFSDGGVCTATHIDIVENSLPLLPSLTFKRSPVSLPEYRRTETNKVFEAKKDLLSALGIRELAYVTSQGRTVIFKTREGKYLAIKLCRQGEDPGKLIYENKIFGFLNDLKRRGSGLLGKYPRPLFSIHGGTVRIKERDLPPGIKERIENIEKKDGIKLSREKGYYTMMLYEAEDLDYFTYLQDIQEESLWQEALERNINDLFILAGYGLVHPDISDLFHNVTMPRDDSDRGKYLWMVDIIRRIGGRTGAGRLHSWQKAVKYPNMRLSGPADFAEITKLDALLSLRNEHSNYMYEDLKRFSPDEREKFLLAHFTGNYFLTVMLLAGERMKNTGGRNWENEEDIKYVSELMKKVYSSAYRVFTGREENEVESIVRWELLARQMLFFMLGDYKKYVNREIPEEIFGLKNLCVVPGEGWGYLHKEVIEKAVIEGKITKVLKYVLDEYFDEVTGTGTRTFKDTYRFKKEASNKIPLEKDKALRGQLAVLFNDYSGGWRIDGINDDLGPINGPFPIQEFIKANYIAAMMMIGRKSAEYIGEDADREQMGKRAFVISVEGTEKEKEVTVLDSRAGKSKFKIALAEDIRIEEIPELLRGREDIKKTSYNIIEALIKIAEREKIKVYVFDDIVEDLLGFSLEEDSSIAVHKKLSSNPVALFHEITGYLIKKGLVELKVSGKSLYLSGKDALYIFDITDAMESLQEEKEEWSFWKEKEINRLPHYLLRVLQRIILPGEDSKLSAEIKELLYNRKMRVYSEGFGASHNSFYDLVSFIEDSLHDENRRTRIAASEIMITLLDKGLVSREECARILPINMICGAINRADDPAVPIKILRKGIVSGVFTREEIREKIDIEGIIRLFNGSQDILKPVIALGIKGLIENGIYSAEEISEKIDLDSLAAKINSSRPDDQRNGAEALNLLREAGAVEKEQIEDLLSFERFNATLKDINTPRRVYFYILKTVHFLATSGIFEDQLKEKKVKDVFLSFFKNTIEEKKMFLKAEAVKSLMAMMEKGGLSSNDLKQAGVIGMLEKAVQSSGDDPGFIRTCWRELSDIILMTGKDGAKIAEALPVRALTRDLTGKDPLLALYSARALGGFVKNGILTKEEASARISPEIFVRGISDANILDPSVENFYERIRVLQELISSELIDPSRISKENMPDPQSLLRAGLRHWNFDRVRILRGIKTLIETGLLINIRQADFLHEAVEKIYDEKQRPFLREVDPFFLKVSALNRENRKNVIEKYLTPDMVRVLKIGGSYAARELAVEAGKNKSPREIYEIVSERLLDSLLGVFYRIFDTAAFKELYHTARKTGKLVSFFLLRGEKLTANIKGACKILFVELKDSGQVIDTTSYLFESAVHEIPGINFKESPAKKPEYIEKRHEELPLMQWDTDLFSLMEKFSAREKHPKFVTLLGRTAVYKTPENKFIALKFLKQGEDPGKLMYENKIFDYLKKMKKNGSGLKGKYPEPVLFNYEDEKVRVIRVGKEQIPGRVYYGEREEDIISGIERTMKLDNRDNVYTLMAYETEDLDYFTYIDTLSDTERALDSLELNIHDLLVLAKYGLVHPDLISIFHSSLSDMRPDDGKYVWMVDVVRPGEKRMGAGRLEAWEKALAFNNMRVSGPADFAEISSIEELVSLEKEHSGYLMNNLSRFEPKKRKMFLLSYFIGNYTLIAVLNEAKRMKTQGILNNEKKIEDTVKRIYRAAYSGFMEDKEDGDIIDLVDWERMSRQISFFIGGEYKNYADKILPRELYGLNRAVILPGDGWGFIHENIIEQELLKINIPPDGELYQRILETYFMKAVPSSGRSVKERVYVFKEDTEKKLLLEEVGIGAEIKKIYDKYSSGWRANGEDEDLGPVNGPNPLTELIRANYIFTMAMIARFPGTNGKQTQAAEKAEKTAPIVVNAETYKHFGRGSYIKLEMFHEEDLSISEGVVEIKDKGKLEPDEKEILMTEAGKDHTALLKRVLMHLPRFINIFSIEENSYGLTDIVFVPETNLPGKIEVVAGREELIDSPYYKFYLLILAFLEFMEKREALVTQFDLELREDILFINVGGNISRLEVAEAKKSLLNEGDIWAFLPESVLNLKRNKKYLVRILCRQIFKDKDRKFWSRRRALLREETDDINRITGKTKICRFLSVEEIEKELIRDIKITPLIHKKLKDFYGQYLEIQRGFLEQKPAPSLRYLHKCFNAERIADLFYLNEVYRFNVLELTGIKRKTFWEKGQRKYEITLSAKNKVKIIEKNAEGDDVFIGEATNNEYVREHFSGDERTDQYYGLNLGNFLIKTHNYVLWALDNIKEFEASIMQSGGDKLVSYYRTIGFGIEKESISGKKARRMLLGGLAAGILTREDAQRIRGLTPYLWKSWSQRYLDRYLRLIKGIERHSLDKAYPVIESFIETLTTEERKRYTPEKIADMVKNITRSGNRKIGKRTELLFAEKNQNEVKIIVRGSTGEFIEVYGKKKDIRKVKEILTRLDPKDDTHKLLLLKAAELLENSPPDFYVYDILPEDLFGKAIPMNRMIITHKSVFNEPAALFHEIMEYYTDIEKSGIKLRLEGKALKVLLAARVYDLLERSGRLPSFIKGRIIIEDKDTGNEICGVTVQGESLAIAVKDITDAHYLLRAVQREISPARDKNLSAVIVVEQKRKEIKDIVEQLKVSKKSEPAAFGLMETMIHKKIYREDNKAPVISFLRKLARSKGEKQTEAFELAKEFFTQELVAEDRIQHLALFITDLLYLSEVLPKDRFFVAGKDQSFAKAGHIVTRKILAEIGQKHMDSGFFTLEFMDEIIHKAGKYRLAAVLRIMRILVKHNSPEKLKDKQTLKKFLLEMLSKTGNMAQEDSPVHSFENIEKLIEAGTASEEILKIEFIKDLMKNSGSRFKEALNAVKEIAEAGVMDDKSFPELSGFIKTVIAGTNGENVNAEKLKFVSNAAGKGVLTLSGAESVRTVMEQISREGMNRTYETGAYEILNAMLKAECLTADILVKTVPMFEALIKKDLVEQIRLLSDIKDLIAEVENRNAPQEAADPEFLSVIIKREEEPSRTISEIVKLARVRVISKPEMFCLQEWIKECAPSRKGVIRTFLDLSPRERTEYLKNKSEIINEIGNGAVRKDTLADLMAGYEILAGDFRKNNIDIAFLPGFEFYKKSMEGHKGVYDVLDEKEKAEARYAAYESVKLRDFLTRLKEKADERNQPMVVVANLSFGKVLLGAVETELRNMGVRIIETHAKSTYAHGHPEALHGRGGEDDPFLFKEEDLRFIIREQPLIAVVDGSVSIDRGSGKMDFSDSPHFADAFQVFRNYFHAISRDPEDEAFGLDGIRGSLGRPVAETLRESPTYKALRKRAGDISGKRPDYSLFFWHPGKKDININNNRDPRKVPESMRIYNLYDPETPYFEKIRGPAVVFINANMHDSMIPDHIRAGLNEKKGDRNPAYHNSGYFDHPSWRERYSFHYGPKGPRAINAVESLYLEEYEKIKRDFLPDTDNSGESPEQKSLFTGRIERTKASPESLEIQELDPRVWRVWSQRELDIFFALIKDIDPDIVKKGCKEFSLIHKDKSRDFLRKVSPNIVAEYISGYYISDPSPDNAETSDTESFNSLSEDIRKAPLKGTNRIRKVITSTNSGSINLLSLIERIREKYGLLKEDTPVDIVVDLTLISEEDERENLESWAHLILICAKMKNVNFIFEQPETPSKEFLPDELLSEIRKASEREKAITILKIKIRGKIEQMGLYDEIDPETFFAERIGGERREGAIEIPIISKIWLKWREERSWLDPAVKLLEKNQFPVAMEDISHIKDEGLLLRNFQAALSVGLLKAQLVMIQRKDKKIEQNDLKDIMSRLQSIYDVFNKFYPNFPEIKVDEYFLSNMISEHETVRLGHAIRMALPAITRMLVEELKKYHRMVQSILQSA